MPRPSACCSRGLQVLAAVRQQGGLESGGVEVLEFLELELQALLRPARAARRSVLGCRPWLMYRIWRIR
jgi:hypothetical protein